METSKLGESIYREWGEDARASELRDALQLVRADRTAGLEKLTELAESGSSLGMMYLGNIYVYGRHGVEKNEELGERWLRRAADAGSNEGGYGLARHLQASGRYREALVEYEKLADRKFSPALFILGWQYYKGDMVEKNVEKSLAYFRRGEELGHLHAAWWIAYISMKESSGLLGWASGLAKRISLFIPFVKTAVSYPTSDRLRK